MAVPFWAALLVLSPLALFLGFYIHFRLVGSKYWSDRNIPHLKPVFLLGNYWRTTFTENFQELLKKMHLENRHKKVLGTWLFQKPQLLVMDKDIAKTILIRDFSNFRDRGLEINEELDPLAGHLFLMKGVKWRNLRVKLTPTFTSGKMKFMFPTVVDCGRQLQAYLKKYSDKGEDIEVKDLLARFTTDIISSCAFGIQTNSLENPDSEFRQFGKKIFQVDFKGTVMNLLAQVYPKIFKVLRLRFIPKESSDFFMNAVRETVEYREKNNISRNDFLQLLIQLMRAGKVEDADRNPVDAESYTDEELVYKFELSQAAAQCFVFFAAGFETSSTLMTFALYELALNPDIQKRLQDEIDAGLKKTGNELTYEEMNHMEYLDMVVQESLRKYPPVANLQRVCNADYTIPELNTTIEKGTMVVFSVSGFHEDPEEYPKPEKFDPERFTHEERNRRHAMAFLPFGEGPRNCIGNRFALMQTKVGLISILRDFDVVVTKKTPIPLVYEKRAFIPTAEGGMYLLFKKRD